MFENRALRKTCESLRGERRRSWRQLHAEERHVLYSSLKYSGDQIKKNEIGGAHGTYGWEETCVRVWW
jgi:hypothetical protein